MITIETHRITTLEAWHPGGRVVVEQDRWQTAIDRLDTNNQLVDLHASVAIDLDTIEVGQPLRWTDLADRTVYETAPIQCFRVTYR